VELIGSPPLTAGAVDKESEWLFLEPKFRSSELSLARGLGSLEEKRDEDPTH
jgi:hypothetical protein